ncbi:hypothetical protein ACJX0J_005639, partial [Zea mays]
SIFLRKIASKAYIMHRDMRDPKDFKGREGEDGVSWEVHPHHHDGVEDRMHGSNVFLYIMFFVLISSCTSSEATLEWFTSLFNRFLDIIKGADPIVVVLLFLALESNIESNGSEILENNIIFDVASFIYLSAIILSSFILITSIKLR